MATVFKCFISVVALIGVSAGNCLAIESPKPETPVVMKVGVIVPLTGPLAEFGIAMQNGIKLAARNMPDDLEHLQFVFEDSAYNPQTAITAFRKLTSQDKVQFVINLGCPTSLAVIPLAEQLKIPTALFCSANLMTKGKQFAFSMTSPAIDFATVLANHFLLKKYSRICMVLTENDYLLSEMKSLERRLNESNGVMTLKIVQRFLPTDLDFKSAIAKFSPKDCDALGVYLLPGQVRAFFNQFEGRGLTLPIFGTDIFESPDEIKAAKGAMENSVFVNIDVPPEFNEQYRLNYTAESQIATACSTHALLEAVVKSLKGAATGTGWFEVLKTTNGLLTKCGPVSFVRAENGEQYLNPRVVLKTIKNEKVELLTTSGL